METTTKDQVKQPTAIVKFMQDNNVSSEQQAILESVFNPLLDVTTQWKEKAGALVVTDVNQKKEMAEARTARLALKDIRTNVEKKRKELKEESLRTGKAIDSVANFIKGLIEPIEEHLDKQEHFAEIEETNRKEALKKERIALISPFVIDPNIYHVEDMPEEAFNSLAEGLKLAHEKRIADAAKANEIPDSPPASGSVAPSSGINGGASAAPSTTGVASPPTTAAAPPDAQQGTEKVEPSSDKEKIAQLVKEISAIKIPEVISKKGKTTVNVIKKTLDKLVTDYSE